MGVACGAGGKERRGCQAGQKTQPQKGKRQLGDASVCFVVHKRFLVNAVKKMLPLFALILAMALWGSSFVAVKYGVRDMPPAVLLFGRMVAGALCFLPFLGSLRRLRQLDPFSHPRPPP